MVAEILISCSFCHREGKPRVPAVPIPAQVEGSGGLYDACQEHDLRIFEPLRQLAAAGLVRPNRGPQEKLPPGWVHNDAQARPNAAGDDVPAGHASREFLCLDATCVYPGVGTESGLRYHMKEAHPDLDVRECISKVTRCGLCPPSEQIEKTTNWAGQHCALTHVDLLPKAVKETKGHALWLISEVRRQGDPHNTLKALDTYVAKIMGYGAPKSVAAQANGANRAESQLALAGTGGDN